MEPNDDPPREGGHLPWAVALQRREFVAGGVTLAATSLAPGLAASAPATRAGGGTGGRRLKFVVNGQPRSIVVDPRTSTLDLLREGLALTGTKKGCDHGQCGACTVHLDGRRVLACLTPAVQLEGRQVLTIEGVATADGRLHPVQQAFIDHDALQCGYCTPGQIMSAIACIREGHATSREQVQEFMSGNLCRCGAYEGITNAVLQGAERMPKA